ncbi:MAG: response regulator transcription factor [Solirubrobacterales bacterium]
MGAILDEEARPRGLAIVVVCSADEGVREATCEGLADRHYLPLPAAGAREALRICRYARAHALILDMELPEGSAFDLLRERVDDPRLLDELGVVALIAPGEDPDVLREDPALAVDDHLRRPFAFEDLRHCIEAVLRRRGGRDDSVIRAGDLLVDSPRRRVLVGDRDVHLARREFLLLRFLASDPSRVFTKDELIRAVWGVRYPAGRTRTLDSHASRLRTKLDPERRRFVRNCWGVGYRLLDPVDDVGTASGVEGERR